MEQSYEPIRILKQSPLLAILCQNKMLQWDSPTLIITSPNLWCRTMVEISWHLSHFVNFGWLALSLSIFLFSNKEKSVVVRLWVLSFLMHVLNVLVLFTYYKVFFLVVEVSKEILVVFSNKDLNESFCFHFKLMRFFSSCSF